MVRISGSRIRMAAAPRLMCGLTNTAYSSAKPHVIAFGKWITVSWFPVRVAAEHKPIALKVHPLLVDSRIKEFTLGAHDITDR
jgi:hypothetical protein